MKIGLISDTHGLLRPEVFTAFRGVDHVIHAGDVGGTDILTELEAIAPVTAVWGNTDDSQVRSGLPETARVELAGRSIVVTHGHRLGRPTASNVAAAHPDADLVVFGHTHTPVIERVGAVLVVNPGSAGAARFKLPVTIALVDLGDDQMTARLIELVMRA